MRRTLFFLISVALARIVAGQDVVMGSYEDSHQAILTAGGSPITVIDRAHPANADGNVSSIQMALDGTCGASTFTIRFFRPDVTLTGGYTLIDERGPFTASAGIIGLSLLPPIAVKRGDEIGVTTRGSSPCGMAVRYSGQSSIDMVVADYRGGPAAFTPFNGHAVELRASSDQFALVGLLPGVGRINGAAGSAFDTSFVISNPSSDPVDAFFVFHGADGSQASTLLTLPALGSSSANLLEMMGANGLGTIDVYSDSAPPVVTARIFNDSGNGTNGFTESVVPILDIPHDGDRVWMTIPSDLTNYRMNIGVRSMGGGGSFQCNAYTRFGDLAASITKSISADAFSLDSLQSFFGNPAALTPGGSIGCSIEPFNSDVVIFDSVTDNRTNDSAMFVAERH